MGKDKFKKRQQKRRLIRAEMTKRGISGREIAAQAGVCEAAVSRYCATSPRVVEALIKAGVPERLFGKKARSSQPKPPLTPPYKGGEGEGEHRQDGCLTEGA
jgi:lambda repressor-like predicted transcriptional regulator